MQWLCNTWNIGYILVPLQRKKLKRNFSLWSDWKSGEKSGQGCECSDGALAGNMMEITQLLLLLLFLLPPFFSQNSKPLKIANSLCRVNPQNSPRARLFKWSQIPLGTANPAPTPPQAGLHSRAAASFSTKVYCNCLQPGARGVLRWIENQALMRMNLLIWHI